MPDIKRLTALIHRLNELSDADRIPWFETSNEKVFQAALKTYTVTIAEEPDTDWTTQTSSTYTISIHDPAGRLLDSAKPADFVYDDFPGGRMPFVAFAELYDKARRKAFNVDQALDDLLGSLG